MKAFEIKKVLSLIAKGRLTRAAAATGLGCSPRHVNRLMLEHGVQRPPGVTRAAREAAHAARAGRQRKIECFALDARRGDIDVATAAARAGCSIRTIYRYRCIK